MGETACVKNWFELAGRLHTRDVEELLKVSSEVNFLYQVNMDVGTRPKGVVERSPAAGSVRRAIGRSARKSSARVTYSGGFAANDVITYKARSALCRSTLTI